MSAVAVNALCVAIAMLVEDLERGEVTKAGFKSKIESAIASARAQAPERGDDREDFRVLQLLAGMLDDGDRPPTLRLVQ